MRMVMTAAGFSGGESEELRRAMGSRRSRARMQRLVEKMHSGMQERGIDQAARDEIVNSIVSFALYGFPESHAASFALIAWASAWLKVHHPAAFTAALLNCWPMGFYSPATLVQDARRHGVAVLPVDVNRSDAECTLETTPDGRLAIRLGLKFIKGLAGQTIGRIQDARKSGGYYRDILDVGERAMTGRAELMLIADAGAAPPDAESTLITPDNAETDPRRDALWQAMAFDPATRLLHRQTDADDDDIREFPCAPGPESFQDMLDDFRTTGITVGKHPMSFIRRQLDGRHVIGADELALIPDGVRARVAGMIIVRQRPPTARGFYFATIEDETGHAAIAVRPDLFTKNRLLLSTATFLLFGGIVQNRNHVTSLLADEFIPMPSIVGTQPRSFH